VDLRNNNDVSADHPEVVAQLWAELKSYKAEKGEDWRLEMYGH